MCEEREGRKERNLLRISGEWNEEGNGGKWKEEIKAAVVRQWKCVSCLIAHLSVACLIPISHLSSLPSSLCLFYLHCLFLTYLSSPLSLLTSPSLPAPPLSSHYHLPKQQRRACLRHHTACSYNFIATIAHHLSPGMALGKNFSCDALQR